MSAGIGQKVKKLGPQLKYKHCWNSPFLTTIVLVNLCHDQGITITTLIRYNSNTKQRWNSPKLTETLKGYLWSKIKRGHNIY